MLDATISILAAPHASPAARDASLAILEAILELDQPLQVSSTLFTQQFVSQV